MEYNYKMYRGLKNLQASKLIRKSNNATLLDEELVRAVLADGEEVLFNLES
jgi:hypothetical protein